MYRELLCFLIIIITTISHPLPNDDEEMIMGDVQPFSHRNDHMDPDVRQAYYQLFMCEEWCNLFLTIITLPPRIIDFLIFQF